MFTASLTAEWTHKCLVDPELTRESLFVSCLLLAVVRPLPVSCYFLYLFSLLTLSCLTVSLPVCLTYNLLVQLVAE